jgi:hypothetical protein
MGNMVNLVSHLESPDVWQPHFVQQVIAEALGEATDVADECRHQKNVARQCRALLHEPKNDQNNQTSQTQKS